MRVLGFKPTSDIYLEDGIEHIEMLYQTTGIIAWRQNKKG